MSVVLFSIYDLKLADYNLMKQSDYSGLLVLAKCFIILILLLDDFQLLS